MLAQINGRKVLTLSFLTLLAVGTAYGQMGTSLRGNVPFEFSVGRTVLPAGTYGFVVSFDSRQLTIRGAKEGDLTVQIITELGGGSAFMDASLVFDIFEGKHVLSEVWIPGQGGVLVSATPKGHAHETVIAAASNLPASLSGKAVYERTCQKCHGPEGKGNEAADKFFKVTIPRLNSAYVQSKPDAELKEIITQGRREMEPVRMGQPTVRHLLPLQSVEAVISYVRTFKQQ